MAKKAIAQRIVKANRFILPPLYAVQIEKSSEATVLRKTCFDFAALEKQSQTTCRKTKRQFRRVKFLWKARYYITN